MYVKHIVDCFKREKIEYFSVLKYSDCTLINPRLIERAGFAPRSVIVFLVPYYSGETVNISRYAAAGDYHSYIAKLTDAVITELVGYYPDAKFLGFGDHSPIDEINAALIAGLGILGDNRLLINERYGSYVFIGEIITDVPPKLLGAAAPVPVTRCEGCGSCRTACTGGILNDPCGVCLSSVTQKKGELSQSETELIRSGGSVWGCDACQICCPHNTDPIITPIKYFSEDRIEYLNSETVDNMTDSEFKLRAFSWRGKKTIKRNLDIFGI